MMPDMERHRLTIEFTGRELLRVIVRGKPETAGSKKAFALTRGNGQPVRRGNGSIVVNVVDDNSKSKDWRKLVASEVRIRWGARPLITGPVLAMFVFHLRRPKSHFGSGRNANLIKDSAPRHHLQKPDVLKLARAVEDALKDVIYADDSQIVTEPIRKVWSTWSGIEMTLFELKE